MLKQKNIKCRSLVSRKGGYIPGSEIVSQLRSVEIFLEEVQRAFDNPCSSFTPVE